MKITNDYVFFGESSKLSNSYFCSITYLGRQFRCSEHIFMYCEVLHFKDVSSASMIMNSGIESFEKIGAIVQNFNSDEWDRVKYHYMMEAITAKFTQNCFLKKWFLGPRFDGKTFVMADPMDSVWGIGMAENHPDLMDTSQWGQNLLGKALTELRDKLKQESDLLKY